MNRQGHALSPLAAPSGAHLRALAVAALLFSSASCAMGLPEQRDEGNGASSGVCSGIGPVMDLRSDLAHASDLGPSTEADALVTLDESLGALARAKIASPPSKLLAMRIDNATRVLSARREKLVTSAARLRATYRAVDVAIDAAASCNGLDFRDPGLPKGATRIDREHAALALATEERRATTKKNVAVLGSPACADATRLWSSLRSLDVTSRASSSAVAAHIRELSFDGDRATTRDALRTALEGHAVALTAFGETAKAENDVELLTVMGDLGQELDRAATQCLGSMTKPAIEVLGGNDNAREVVLLVRPKWPDRFGEEAPAMGIFGTGFLVRWRNADGTVEARVVTNAHVMSGAPEADVFTSLAMREDGPDAQSPKGDAAKVDSKFRWRATVIRTSEDDDLAVLRVSASAPGMPKTGIAFRLAPAKDQEPVVAAGFPGIGGQPAFQISKGNISNAQMGGGSQPFGLYLQHTAPIDPGNSGGPLIDGDSRLLGVNTFKVKNRESVGIAIPTSRVQLALLRARDRRISTLKNAEATCNAIVAAFSAPSPARGAVDRFSLALVDPSERTSDARTNAYREHVQGEAEGPVSDIRALAYARLRTQIDDAGGVERMTSCEDVADASGGAARAYTAHFRTRGATQTMTLNEEEDGILRLAQLRAGAPVLRSPVVIIDRAQRRVGFAPQTACP